MKDYNLEERTGKFSLQILELVRRLKKDELTKPLINQLIRSATSVGANYREANGASSKKDFRNKICICKKEAKETAYWLMLLKESNKEARGTILTLEDEAQQLVMIFGKIVSTLGKDQRKL